jgi:hypothetical protein
VALSHPTAVHVLAALGIDLPLESERPLEEACAMRDVHVAEVVARIADLERPSSGELAIVWDVFYTAERRSYENVDAWREGRAIAA